MANGVPEYEEKYIDVRFQNMEKIVDRMERAFEKSRVELDTRFNETTTRIEKSIGEMKAEVDEIKRDNKATRWWVVGTGIAVVSGIAVIFFSFAQIQTSWMQQVISFAIQAIKSRP